LRCSFTLDGKVDIKKVSDAKASGKCSKWKQVFDDTKKCDDIKVKKAKDVCKRRHAIWPANQFVFASTLITFFLTLALMAVGIMMFTSASMNTMMLKVVAISLSAGALVMSWLGWIVYLAVVYGGQQQNLKDLNHLHIDFAGAEIDVDTDLTKFLRMSLSIGWALYFVVSLIYIPWLVIHVLNSTSQ